MLLLLFLLLLLLLFVDICFSIQNVSMYPAYIYADTHITYVLPFKSICVLSDIILIVSRVYGCVLRGARVFVYVLY